MPEIEPGGPGSASAAAVQEAAAGLQTPEFQKAVKDFAGVGGETPAPKPAPAAPAAEPPAGTSPAPAAAAPAETETTTEDPPPQDDYDEEAAAEHPPADGDDWTEDERKAWQQYPSERERAKALAEHQEKLRATQAELDALKAGKAPTEPGQEPPAPAAKPAPPAEITGEVIETTIRKLAAERPDVQQAVQTLGSQREALTAKGEQLETIKAAITEHETTIGKLRTVIEFLEDQAKEDPEDTFTRDKLQAKKQELLQRETRLNSEQIKLYRLDAEVGTLQTTYEKQLDALRDLGVREASRASEEHKESERIQRQKDAYKTEWSTAFGTFIKQHPEIPQSLHAYVERVLLNEAYAEHDGETPYSTWIESQAGMVAEMLAAHRAEVLKGYTEEKKADVETLQPAPRGAAAVAHKPKDRPPMNSREADQQAARALKEALRSR